MTRQVKMKRSVAPAVLAILSLGQFSAHGPGFHHAFDLQHLSSRASHAYKLLQNYHLRPPTFYAGVALHCTAGRPAQRGAALPTNINLKRRYLTRSVTRLDASKLTYQKDVTSNEYRTQSRVICLRSLSR
jgi:hypothetical protein